jgi:hypothetical protein
MSKRIMQIIGRTALILAAAGLVSIGVYALGQTAWGQELVFALRPAGPAQGLGPRAGAAEGHSEGEMPGREQAMGHHEGAGAGAAGEPGRRGRAAPAFREAPGMGRGERRGGMAGEGGPGRPAALNEGLAIVVKDLAIMAVLVVVVVVLLRAWGWWARRRRAAAQAAAG